MATNSNEGGGGGGVAMDRKSLASSAAAMGEVVGDDSMVVGKGIMIKGDVDNCAVRRRESSGVGSKRRRAWAPWRSISRTRRVSYC